MKAPPNAIILLWTASQWAPTADAVCSFCPNGITVSPDPELSEAGKTCAEIATEALDIPDDSFLECAKVKLSDEELCCPPPLNPCSICPDGVTEIDEDGTCEVVNGQFATYEQDSEFCDESIMQGYQLTCCPASFIPSENSCTLCDGTVVNEDLEVVEGATCSDVISQVSLLPGDSEECIATSLYEVLCCPTQASTPCEICPDGYEFIADASPVEDADDDSLSKNEITCSDAASSIEDGSEMCEVAKEEFSSSCCALVNSDSDVTAITNSACSFCPDGITVPSGDPEEEAYCADAVVQALAITDEDSDECATVKSGEQWCCPPAPENPCIICPIGISLGEEPWMLLEQDESVSYEEQCQQLIDFYATTADSDSEECLTYAEEYKSACCPNVPDVPCEICPNGISAISATGSYSTQGCQLMVSQTATLEDGSESCLEAKTEYTSQCCKSTDAGVDVGVPPGDSPDNLFDGTAERMTLSPIVSPINAIEGVGNLGNNDTPSPVANSGKTTEAPIDSVTTPPSASPSLRPVEIPGYMDEFPVETPGYMDEFPAENPGNKDEIPADKATSSPAASPSARQEFLDLLAGGPSTPVDEFPVENPGNEDGIPNTASPRKNLSQLFVLISMIYHLMGNMHI